jgi:branched-chain amino acid transport system ATP-binding protein
MLFPEMSVLENLLMGAYLAPSKAEIDRRLDEVYTLLPKLSDRRDQIASSLSGGERRMVGIGRGLMMGGQILLIDEPSLGLAPLIIEQIYGVITELSRGGRTILLVEENPARVADLANHLHLLDDGMIVWSGPPAELLARDELLATYLGG